MPSASALSSYMSQYASLNAEITAAISKIHRWPVAESSDAEEFTNHNASIDKNFEEIEELFEQMELEIREIGASAEQERNSSQLQSFKAECKRLQSEYQSAKLKHQRRSERDSLVRHPSSTSSDQAATSPEKLLSDSNSHRQRLLDNTETVERSSRKLDQGQEMLNQTESIGATILNDLALQREVLQRSRNRLRDTDDDLGTSSRILSGMIVRIQQSKIIMSLIGAIIISVIIFGVYKSFEG